MVAIFRVISRDFGWYENCRSSSICRLIEFNHLCFKICVPLLMRIGDLGLHYFRCIIMRGILYFIFLQLFLKEIILVLCIYM